MISKSVTSISLKGAGACFMIHSHSRDKKDSQGFSFLEFVALFISSILSRQYQASYQPRPIEAIL